MVKKVVINKPIDWSVVWHLSEAVKSLQMDVDDEGYLKAMPVVIALPTQGDLANDGGKVGTPGVGASNSDSVVPSSGSSFATVSENYLMNMLTGNWERARTPVIFKSITAIAAVGDTAVWTPAGGKKFRIMGFFLVLSQGAAAAALEVIKLKDNATTIIELGVSAAALLATPAVFQWNQVLPGNGYLSIAADNVLNLNLSSALTAGYVDGWVYGTEE